MFSPPPDGPGRRGPSGLALLDGPNVLCALHELLCRVEQPDVRGSLDLARLRDYLHALGIGEFVFVQPFSATRSRANLERDVRRAGWKYNQPTRCIYGYDDKDCADDYIRYRISHAAAQHPFVALISHDGGYRPALESYLQAGGNALILGCVERMSHKLFNLSYDWQALGRGTAKVLDLQFDAQAIEVKGRKAVAHP